MCSRVSQVRAALCGIYSTKKSLRISSEASLAVRTRLELATPCVTGRYSNQAELPHQVSFWDCKDMYFLIISKKNISFLKKMRSAHCHISFL